MYVAVISHPHASFKTKIQSIKLPIFPNKRLAFCMCTCLGHSWFKLKVLVTVAMQLVAHNDSS